jgi:hypothetical protein
LSGLDETIGGKSSTSHEKVRPHLSSQQYHIPWLYGILAFLSL